MFPSPLVPRLLAAAFVLVPVGAAQAETVQVAVAANFTDAANELGRLFAERTEHDAVLSFGATGQFYTQITQGAPFEVFLAADDDRPERAVVEGYGVEGSVFTYAIGQLVLYSADRDRVTGEDTLRDADIQRIAIANPETAPYGAAAVEAMRKLGLYETLSPRIVQGTSIAQAYQFVETGNAEIGFVALGQVVNAAGSRWDVPQSLYEPIRQDAVLLKTGENNPAARAFAEFLRTPQALDVIRRYGYRADE